MWELETRQRHSISTKQWIDERKQASVAKTSAVWYCMVRTARWRSGQTGNTGLALSARVLQEPQSTTWAWGGPVFGGQTDAVAWACTCLAPMQSLCRSDPT